MTTYRWAVVAPDGSIVPCDRFSPCPEIAVARWLAHQKHGTIRWFLTEGAETRENLWAIIWRASGYRVARFKLVECEEGEGDGE